MLTALWVWVFSSPLKVAIVAANRLATWPGLFMVWRKLRGLPNRPVRFLGWWVVLNALSFSALAGVLWVVTHASR